VTAAADNSVRLWHLPNASSSSSSSSSPAPSMHPLSGDMSRIVFMAERSPTDAVRCLKISPDFTKLITGDKAGRVKMFSLPSLKLLCSVDAHDAEVLSVDVCAPSSDLVASAGRDRLVHVFQITGNSLVLLNTIDDHFSSVTAVKFCGGGKVLASCATDKSIIFRSMDSSSSVGPRVHSVSSKRGTVSYGSIFDLVVDPKGMFALTCGQNRQVTIWDVATATQRRSYKMDVECTFKVALDSAVSKIACAGSDHAIRIIDWYSGQVITEGFGHSEPATSLCFSHDNAQLVTVSADGCIFIWSLQNPRQSKSSSSADTAISSSAVADHPAQAVPRLLLEVPDASDLQPPAISSRAKQAEEQRALLYRMLGGNQPPLTQQQQRQENEEVPQSQLLLESAKLPVSLF
jgi:WD40 repeat protein